MKPSSPTRNDQRCFEFRTPTPLFTWILLATVAAGGCGAEPGDSSTDLKQVGLAVSDSSAATPAAGDKSKRPGQPVQAARKIIYDARVEITVDSLNATEQAISALVQEHDGFLAESDQASVTATQRRGMWRVRVPVDRFRAFLTAVTRLGEVRQNHVGSQDVTEEYIDLEARIRNKREEEKRLIKHLADSTGKLEDILAVEKELSRVRGEIEQMEGRLRFLANRAELSTVTIEALEWKDYKPPVAATFSTQLGRTFYRSVESLVDFGKTLLLIAVALAPWLPLIGLAILLVRWMVIRSTRGGVRSRPAALAPGGGGRS
jgi:Domain of unknown function (DUF4349)